MSSTILHLKVVTPLFSEDDPEGKTDSPIRVPTVRGALRFWFRAVARGHGITDTRELWEAESEVFGCATNPSPIGVRIARQPTAAGAGTRPRWAARTEVDGFAGAQHLLGRGLWGERGLARPFVEPDERIILKLRFSGVPHIDARFTAALWAWLTFGGLGMQTRRGLGKLRCTLVEQPAGACDLGLLATPAGRQAWHDLLVRPLPEALGCEALGWTGVPGASDVHGPGRRAEPQEWPALTPGCWVGEMIEPPQSCLADVLHQAGLQWRAVCAEPSSIVDGHIGRTVVHGLRPAMVWLRPLRLPDGRWGLFTHGFRTLGGPAQVPAARRELPVPEHPAHQHDQAVRRWAEQPGGSPLAVPQERAS